MNRSTGSVAGLVAVLALTLLVPVADVSAAAPADGDGDISVTIVDPTPDPTPQPSTTQGPGGGSSSPGRGGSGGDETTPDDGSSEPDAEGSGGHWIVVSGLDNSAHGELNPFRGWVRSTVSVANRSETETVGGRIVFRLRTIFGAQIGPALTRPLADIEPGTTRDSSVELVGVGQWPLVQVSATFEPDGPSGADPITREAWVLALPWLLLAILVLMVAAAAILWLRRAGVRPDGRAGGAA
ncbi:MAG: hypothetical protein QM598_12485 [Protaetiibacter sp.]